MRLHWLQHVPFEGLGHIETWARKEATKISCTRLFAGECLPDVDDIDWLIVMGGPMGIYDHGAHAWLVDEKRFIREAIHRGKTVVGICLGAQLMADVLGAEVYPGPQKEIGWFPIQRAPDAPDWFPEEITAFHWHGDTFEIPEGAVSLAVSEPGINQGFVYNGKALALQFHMETTPASMEALIENCGQELSDAPYIQSAAQMRAGESNIGNINDTMTALLNRLLHDAD